MLLFLLPLVLCSLQINGREIRSEYLTGDELISYINAKAKTFKAVNYGWSMEEIKARAMPIGSDPILMRTDQPPNLDHIRLDQIPDEFDSRLQWPFCSSIKQVYDQSKCGCCYAFCTTELMSDRFCIFSSRQIELSVDDVMSCCPDCGSGCDGGSSMGVLQHFISDGFVTGGENAFYSGCRPYPFPPCKSHSTSNSCPYSGYQTPACNQTCQSNYNLSYEKDKNFGKTAYYVASGDPTPSTISNIQKEIMTNGPVKATFTVYEDLYHYKSGVYVHTGGQEIGLHCVKIIGWGLDNGTPYWLVTNSWNTNWGENGFFRIIRGINECGFEQAVGAGMPAV